MDKVILELCDRFSVTVEELLPQIAKHGQFSSILGFVISGLILAICCFIFVSVLKRYNKGTAEGKLNWTNNDAYIGGMVVSGALGVVTLIIAIVNFYALIMWILSPKIMAIRYILSLVGK